MTNKNWLIILIAIFIGLPTISFLLAPLMGSSKSFLEIPGVAAITTLLIIVFAFLVYFAPSLQAYQSKKKNAGAILALNLLLGWSVIGWIIALVWSLTKDSN